MSSNHGAPPRPAAGSTVAVLGAGMLGMTLALRLAQRGCTVTLFEAAAEPGGLTRFTAVNGINWDRFYHVIDASDSALLDLLDELGLVDEVQWRTTKTLLYDGVRHHPLNNALDYLRLPVLSFIGKCRVAANIIYAGARRRAGALESIPAASWLSRWSGGRAYEQLWAPLLRSKLGTNYNSVSAAFIWSVIRRFYGARQGSTRTEQFGFLPGSYARIVHALEQALNQHGVTILTDAPVSALVPATNGGFDITAGDANRHFSRAVVTFAGPLAANALSALGAQETAAHRALRYQGVVCLSLLLTRPLGGAYMTYITDNSVPFTTVIEMTALTGSEYFGGSHLVYLPRYVPSDDPFLDATDDDITADFLSGLKRLYPDFSTSQLVASHIARARHVMALPTLDYSRHLPPLETSAPGLFVCNSAHIINASLSVTESVGLANDAAPLIAANG